MNGPAGPEEAFVGVVALVLAGLLARRIEAALRTGIIPLYRTRTSREEAGAAKFNTLVAINAAALIVLLVAGFDLLLGLGLR